MRTVLILLAFLPGLSFAEGYAGADGTNRRGELVHIGEGGMGGDSAEGIYVFKNTKSYASGKKWKERYALLDECPSFLNGPQFSCSANGKSPLAGSTYKITTSKTYRPCDDGSIGRVYVCVAGCKNPRTPKIFYESPWECVP